ncbi:MULTISPECIES: glycosyltransferase [unclassified Microcoleus]|uniref:glycosyltransferase family 2 protein n=2 Tax=unclassified Microcoleus TaxID=2642155 RepID=UPI001E005529|nr:MULTISPECIES: glycosyltransferase [unclassified Microcoleus]MCC3431184.1 glycosyltransferase [Microcoleus sp. PH2017_04_SCI_O_A]MCC3444004.1 glycosyltransferase [Microcoleus sp. PH2017_03_ELD_O_A]MCC3468016.1 glycosyltransferase [Microcoleus sp. PH2017_06_SFM_O_A]MCC3504079.1 glycosyltransferase [Microcoleus sp. PH2017_19_SFW_U_A]MCC3511373.1 glycosyltransferase [Microcoleus sp. PH2017_17_BER_D_A]TAE09945.1 MAG: glycosyltransferase [Oscillatoriales cyanobacterium]
MATAILDLEISQLPPEIAVEERYSKALVLIRLHGKPIGQATLPAVGGRIDGSQLRETLMNAVGDNLWKNWLYETLEWDERGPVQAMPTATVAVCTRDRPEDLQRCLDALMRLPDDGQEYLVIDNCPATEATRELVENYPKVRYVREDVAGSSTARNRAVLEAKGEVIALTDDDAVPDPNWLRSLLHNFGDPRVMCVTGLVMPLELETEAQEWFERYSPHGRGFQRVIFDGAYCNPLIVAPIGVSASMALRKSAIDCVGLFDEALGVGTPAKCGEDHELYVRILTAGYRIIYEPRALSWHRHRRDWEDLRKTMYCYGIGVYAFWTRTLVKNREFSIPLLAWGWLRYKQLPELIASLRNKPDSIPKDLLLAQLRGCIGGPMAYFASRKRLQEIKGKSVVSS